MFLIVDNSVISGITDQETAVEVPDAIAEEIEALLLDRSKILRWVNGDVRVDNNPRFWEMRLHEHIDSLTKPLALKINYGEDLHFPISDLNIITAYACGELHRNRNYCDLDNALHMLTTYEWKNVLDQICDTLSQLAQIRNASSALVAESEERFIALSNLIQNKVNAAYGRP